MPTFPHHPNIHAQRKSECVGSFQLAGKLRLTALETWTDTGK
jgi:hypothetical protein